MSTDKWAYVPDVCDGQPCPGDCDYCDITDIRLSGALREPAKSMRSTKDAPVFCRECRYADKCDRTITRIDGFNEKHYFLEYCSAGERKG